MFPLDQTSWQGTMRVCINDEQKDWVDTGQDWTSRDERIMVVHLNIGSELLSLVIAYGPNKDEKTETKVEFYKALQRELDNAKGKIILLGDLNGRVGKWSDRAAWRKPFEQ
ncbi:hypothetical protein ILUMI_12827 [Ignelater luminosus]|uniref:Craniofacial development protein 2-like n=1 Tax=Ignelater luminosus TaxID=2038154 RepID=A0A8K0CTG5_IGNLU|nr:hypothetical protein ILUMI_12827 [Ignelater luminosus]